MKVTRKSMISGESHTMDLPITQAQLETWMESNTLIQNAFPHLTEDQREFLLTGTTAEEWNETFPPEEREMTTKEAVEGNLNNAVANGFMMELATQTAEEIVDEMIETGALDDSQRDDALPLVREWKTKQEGGVNAGTVLQLGGGMRVISLGPDGKAIVEDDDER